MDVNADFERRVVVHGARVPWVDSPMAGVQRRMLDRVGDEVARATSIVRYAPGSAFSPHVHGGGEEIVVLDGVFQDEHGDFPAGSYLRNPPTSRHTPRSSPGCVIFVKLWQFDPNDRTSLRVDMNAIDLVSDVARPGIAAAMLFEDAREAVELQQWSPRASVDEAMPDGAELLVLGGSLVDTGDTLETMSWLRLPPGARLTASAGAQGARVWMKRRHLRFVRASPSAPARE
jgi:hypothetical protein